MNAIARSLTLIAGLSLSAAAVALEPAATLRWDCQDAYPPTYAQTAGFYDLRNPDQIHDARLTLHFTLQRACARGAQTVEIVRIATPTSDEIRVATR